MSWQADEVINGYRLIRELCEEQGGFGTVWLAERQNFFLSLPVVLKLPRLSKPATAFILENEAKIWSKAMPHPNILPLIDVFTHDDHLVLVSLYCSSGTLERWQDRPHPWREVWDIGEGILTGLSHLHTQDILHLDLKPSNVALLFGIPQIMDFGLARLLDPAASFRLTQYNVGTVHYMCPELFDDQPLQSAQADIWAVGVLLYQLLSGRLPFPGHPNAMAVVVRSEPLPALPHHIPDPICQVINRALSKERTQRYNSALEMHKALREARELVDSEEIRQLRDSLQLSEQRRIQAEKLIGSMKSPIKEEPVSQASSLSEIAEKALQEEKYGDAEAAFRQILLYSPNDIVSRLGLAKSLNGQHRFTDAEIEAREVIQRDSKLAAAYNVLGSALNNQARATEAEQAYSQAISLDPNVPLYWANRAGVHLHQARKIPALRSRKLRQKAIDDAQRAVELGFTRDDHWVIQSLQL